MILALLILIALGLWLEPTAEELAQEHFENLNPDGQAAFRFAQSGFDVYSDHAEIIVTSTVAEAVPGLG